MKSTNSPSMHTHGGARPGAGRKKSGKKVGGPHRLRPALSRMHPAHVSLRTVRTVPRLRQRNFYAAIRRVLLRYLEAANFRVVHLSIQHNHLHFLVEATNARALSTGMQSLAINLARAINAACHRTGKVFAFRYHATQVKTDRYARNVLAYVLNNWRRHREDRRAPSTILLDPYSSACSFPGWTIKCPMPTDYEPLPVSRPRTDLLASAWQFYGLLLPTECPGPVA